MANQKISELGLAAPLTGSEESEVLQTGANKRVSKATDKEFFRRNLPDPTLAQDADTLAARQVAVTAAINALKDSVPAAGDTLNKLYNLITSMGRPRGAFDASSGAVPTPTADNEAGDFWRITVGGTIGTMVLKPGDLLVADIDDAAVVADFYAVQGNVDQASETELGLVELANQTEAETVNGTVGTLDHVLAITVRGWRWCWNKMLTVAQTIAAKWTFNDVALTNQIQSGKKVGVFIDTDGTLKKVAEAVYDSTLKKWVYTGSDTSSSTVSARWENSALELILELYNNKVVKFGGDSAILEVNIGTESGNATLRFLSYTTGAGLGFRFQDDLLNDYINFRSLTSDRGVVLRQSVEYNYGVGELVFTRQFKLTLPNTTASANHVIFEYTLAEEEHYEIKIEKAEAIALNTDGSKSITSSFGIVDTADVRRITAGSIEGNTIVSDQSRLPSTVLSGGFNWVIDTGTNKIQYCFRNGASPDNETYDIFVHISVVKRSTPLDA